MFHPIFRSLVSIAPVFLFLLAANAVWAADSGEVFSRWSSVLDDVVFEGSSVQSCSACDTGSVACGSACDGDSKLLGLFAPSDPCYDSFISPMTNPVFFEDPRTLTEARAIFLRHKVPTAAGGAVPFN